ncbi:hypothetical protein Tco_0941681 [Tanacetum coccineum]|uniref:Uncharacterized protein n=1 Tax=Tanacetum coccineum TaxID=301880 RepID=A0ABQ5DRL4_9ASTR
MAHLSQLALAANSIQLTVMMALLFENDNERDFKLVRETYVMCQELTVRCQERREKIVEMQRLIRSNVAAESVRLLRELQDDEFEKARGMMKLISETHLKVQLPVVLDRANVFEKNGIDPSDYTITLAHGLSLDVDDPVDVALAYREKMFSEKPPFCSLDNSKRIDDSTEKYSNFEVNYDGMFIELPLSKDVFSKDVVLDAGGSSSTTSLSFVLKKKGKSRVKFTKKRAILKRSKMLSLRKGVRSHKVKAGVAKRVTGRPNYGSLVSLIGLNEDVGDDDPQLAIQLSQTDSPSNNDFKDVD